MKKKNLNTQIYRLFIVIGILIVLLGVTYAYWIFSKTQEKSNIIISKCLKLNVNFEDGLKLKEAWPISDEDALASDDKYEFTVKNICDVPISYEVGFVDITSNPTKELMLSSIRTYIDGEISSADILDNSDYSSENVISRVSKVLRYNTLNPGETKTHTFRMWISEDSENEQGHQFEIKMFVRAGQGIIAKPNVKIIGDCTLNDVGCEVAIGGEHFYVIGNNLKSDGSESTNEVRLLAKYNLNIGYDTYPNGLSPLCMDSDYFDGLVGNYGDCLVPVDENAPTYLLQSKDAKGYYSDFMKYSLLIDGSFERHTIPTTEFFETLQNFSSSELSKLFSVEIDFNTNQEWKNTIEFYDPEQYDGYWMDDDYEIQEYPFQKLFSTSIDYVYDKDSTVYPYVNQYKNLIESNYNISVKEARLFSYEEARNLGCSANKCLTPEVINNNRLWLVSTSYWIGNCPDNFGVMFIGTEGYMAQGTFGNEGYYGIRPVIVVSKSIFN